MKIRLKPYLKLATNNTFKFYNTILSTPILLFSFQIILGIIFYKFIFILLPIFTLIFIKRKSLLFLFSIMLFLCSFLYTSNYLSKFNSEVQNIKLETTGYVIEPIESKDYFAEVIIHLDNYKGYTQIKTSNYSKLTVGDKINFEGEIIPLSKDNFNYSYLTSKRINSTSEFPKITVTQRGKSLTSILALQREKLVETINQKVNEPNATLLAGILLGKKESFDKDLETSLIRSGTSHIVSASGTNVVIIYLIVSSLEGIINKRVLNILSGIMIILYLFLIGFYILPAARATVMLLIFLLGRTFGRKSNIIIALNISIIFLLIHFPLFYKNISFQLSFFATIGLFSLNKSYTAFFQKIFPFLPKQMVEIISATTAATLATLPIVLMSFGSLSILSILANILTIPFVTILTLFAIAGLLFSFIKIQIISNLIFLIIDSILNLIVEIINKIAAIPFSYSENIKINILIFCLLGTIFIFFNFKRNGEQIT